MIEFLAGVGSIALVFGIVVVVIRLGTAYLDWLNAAEEREQLKRRVAFIERWIADHRNGERPSTP